MNASTEFIGHAWGVHAPRPMIRGEAIAWKRCPPLATPQQEPR